MWNNVNQWCYNVYKEDAYEKEVFTMYLVNGKSENSGTSLYRSYEPKFSKHKDVEIQAYIAYTIGNDLAGKMKYTVKHMSAMIAQGLFKGEN